MAVRLAGDADSLNSIPLAILLIGLVARAFRRDFDSLCLAGATFRLRIGVPLAISLRPAGGSHVRLVFGTLALSFRWAAILDRLAGGYSISGDLLECQFVDWRFVGLSNLKCFVVVMFMFVIFFLVRSGFLEVMAFVLVPTCLLIAAAFEMARSTFDGVGAHALLMRAASYSTLSSTLAFPLLFRDLRFVLVSIKISHAG